MRRWIPLVLLLATPLAAAQKFDPNAHVEIRAWDGDEEKPWQELDLAPPAYPRPENLREFYVSATATNKFMVDESTLAVGADGVIRYVLVIETAGGARNVSYEGIHCKERTWKHYATGRSDGTWAKSQAARIEWRPIENKPVNRHHAALSRELFCPGGAPILSVDEGRRALRNGGRQELN